MFENIMKVLKKMLKKDKATINSKDAAKERLHLVLVQDRANVSADFLELMKQEIIEVIKKYIEVDENLIDVRLTNHSNEDGTNGSPALYANIPIKNIKDQTKKVDKEKTINKENKQLDNIDKEKNIENKEDKNNKETVESEKIEDTENIKNDKKEDVEDLKDDIDKKEENKQKDNIETKEQNVKSKE